MVLGHHYKNNKPVEADGSVLVLGKHSTKDTLIRWFLDDESPKVFLDADGATVDYLLRYVPDAILVDPSRQPFALNPLADVIPKRRAVLVSAILRAIKGIWNYGDSTPTLNMYFKALLLALMDKDKTLLDAVFYLEEQSELKDKWVQYFWDIHGKKSERERNSDISSTKSKIWDFVFEPMVRDCLDQQRNCLDFDATMLVSLREYELGENAKLLGALILASLRVSGKKPHLYIEGAHFGTSFLAELMKLGVPTFLSLQYLDELDPSVKKAVLATTNILAFQTSLPDAEELAGQFDLPTGVNLSKLHPSQSYATVDGMTLELTMPEHKHKPQGQEKRIRQFSKSQYSAPQKSIDKRMGRFFG